MDETTGIRDTILAVATARGSEKTTCPSEIARSLFPQDWRVHMSEVRAAAFELYKDGLVAITQKGIPVDPSAYKGPVRIQITDQGKDRRSER